MTKRDDEDLEVIDIRGSDSPEHVKHRRIAYELTSELDCAAIVLIALPLDGERGCITSAVLHYAVEESSHPRVGAALISGMRACSLQLEAALIVDGGNHGEQKEPN